MADYVLCEKFSGSGEYKYEVCRRGDGAYQVSVEKKYSDSDGYMPVGWFQYLPVSDMLHVADTLQQAIQIGDECLRNLE